MADFTLGLSKFLVSFSEHYMRRWSCVIGHDELYENNPENSKEFRAILWFMRHKARLGRTSSYSFVVQACFVMGRQNRQEKKKKTLDETLHNKNPQKSHMYGSKYTEPASVSFLRAKARVLFSHKKSIANRINS